MSRQYRLLLLHGLWAAAVAVFFVGGVTAERAAEKERQQNLGQAVIDWLRSKDGGYFSEKVVFDNGGMFAGKDIREGEVVMVVPPDALLGPKSKEQDDLTCETARRLVYEYATLREESDYWPYVRYVFEDFPHASLPFAWSKEGKKLIEFIVGTDLEPKSFGWGSYEQYCDDDDNDDADLMEAAWRIVVSRGWHHIMVPVFDMVNHRNGEWHNLDRDQSDGASFEVDGNYRIVALKDISAGSQLHNSYNQCHDVTCYEVSMWYLTPQIFSDYGFVEQYPRRFAFDTGFDDDEDLGMVFEIEKKDDEQEVTWLTGHPNANQVAWLESQWRRLKDNEMAQEVAEQAQNLSNQEGRMALEYYHALKHAIEEAVQSAHRHQDGGAGESDGAEL